MNYVAIILALASLNFIKCKSISRNEPYVKVAHWGSNKSETTTRTSRNTQFQNHRLKVQRLSAPNKRNPGVVYQYPVNSKIEKKVEHIPGIGEVVIQDRFEARPLFVYKNKQQSPSNTYGTPDSGSNKQPATSVPQAPPSASTVSSPSFDSFPVYKPPSDPPISAPQPSSQNLYNSPFSSYNPPNFNQDDSSFADSYPPNDLPPSDKSPSTEAPKNVGSSMTLGPPLAHGISDYAHQDNDEFNHPPVEYEDHQSVPVQDPMAMYKYHDGPPDYPPKSEDDVYYPPDDAKAPEKQMMPSMDTPKANPSSPSDDTMDLVPPTNGDDPHGYSFPQYLYDQHHFDHHIYEEIPHTTMAPAKEDKRVSSTHYSYYYLGRKLWYIPLYFSIYFIIYVTVLIVKSIARHKVRLKYTWAEGGSAKRESRTLTLNEKRDEQIPVVYHNVTAGLRNSTRKYRNSVMLMK